MSEHFDALPEEKRDRVLGAGFACFGRDGYKKTAMSEIAALAGVSKAALFHYFGSKRALYLYLFRFACREIAAHLPAGGTDLFESLAAGTRAKLQAMARHPGMYEFLFSAVRETDPAHIAMLYENGTDTLQQSGAQFFQALDWSRLRPGVSPEEAMHLVRWVSDGYIRALTGPIEPQAAADAIERYMQILRVALYREEFQ